MDIIKELETLCDLLSEKIADKTRKIKNGGMNDGDLETIDKLTHSLASVKKIMAFMEDEGYSGYYPMSYTDGGSYRNSYRSSYARGRGQRRDSMGRYSGERGYSRSDLADKMRDLMIDAPDDRTRQEMQRMVEKLENA
jgi:hypothetical protein